MNEDLHKPPTSKKALELELALLANQLQRLEQAKDPVVWAKQKLGDTLWSGQIKILEAVRDHRKTAVATSHAVGKSYDAALLVAWWIDTHEPGDAYVITTAPTAPQVRIILWKEIGRAHQRGNLRGRINQTEWMMRVGDLEESVAIGRKPSDYSPAAFQGKHAPFVLIIVDEANGVRGDLWASMDSLIVNDASKMLIIGNPDDPEGEFYEACKPGSGFHVIHISAFDTPNFTNEPIPAAISNQLIGKAQVEDWRAKWAPSWEWTEDKTRCVMPPDGKMEDTHPFWQSKVLGQFPVQSAAGSLIPLTWIRAAQERTLEAIGPNELGLDVGASEAGDPSCLGHRRGPVFRVIYEAREPDTMKTTGRLLQHLGRADIGAALAKVDYIGVGRGVVDRAREQGLPVYPISVGEASTVYSCRVCKHEWDQALLIMKRMVPHQVRCPQCGSDQVWTVFANMLSQLWWMVRGLFERGEIDLRAGADQPGAVHDEQLGEELMNMRWEPNSKGQTKVTYNDDLPSPNRADALLMAFAPAPRGEETNYEEVGLASAATW